MKKNILGLGFLGLAFFVTMSFVVAQPPQGAAPGQGGGPGRGPGGMMAGPGMMGGGAFGVLMNEQARKDLGITEEQQTKLREAGQKIFEQMRPQQPPQQGGERPRFDPAEMRARMEKVQNDTRTAIESILNKDQVGKLDVMSFQSSGGLDSPMLNVENLRVLNLSEEQVKKINELRDSMFAGGGERFRNMSREERQAAFEENRKKMKDGLLGILSDEQKAKAESLTKETPEYLKRPAGGQPRDGGNRRDFGNWTPGQGAAGENPEREARSPRQQRGSGRSFPGSE